MSDMPREIHAYEYERLKLRFWRLDPTDLGETRYVRGDIADALRHELERLCDVIDPAEAEIVERVLNDPGRTDQAEGKT